MPSRPGLILMEVLILIVMLAVVSLIVVPEFTKASPDSRKGVLAERQRALQEAIDAYQADHDGHYPDERIVVQLTMTTSLSGNVIWPGELDAENTFGPYLKTIPGNPFVNRRLSDRIEIGLRPDGGGNAGWFYSPSAGRIWPDDDAHLHR